MLSKAYHGGRDRAISFIWRSGCISYRKPPDHIFQIRIPKIHELRDGEHPTDV